MPSSIISHKGKKIVFIDYSSERSVDGQIKALYKSVELIEKLEANVLVLSDFTGTHASQKFMDEAKKVRRIFDFKVEKRAAIGIVGVMKILLSAYNLVGKNKLHAFDSKERALDFLVS